MNIIKLVQQLLSEYPKISEFTNDVHVDFTEDGPTNFGLYPNGDQLRYKDVIGNEYRQHNFVLYAEKQSFNDFDRLNNSTFLLELTYWLEGAAMDQPIEVTINEQMISGKLTKLSSANAMLYSIPTGDINDGVTYQLQVYAQYTLER
jgi:hypothetical protein